MKTKRAHADHKHEWGLSGSVRLGYSRCAVCGRHVRTSALSALKRAQSVKRILAVAEQSR